MKGNWKRLLALALALVLFLPALPTARAVDNQTPFTDVPNGKWYTAAVNYVYANGLMSGTTSTTFGPTKQLQRGQIMTILYQLAGTPAVTGSSPFADVPAGKYYTNAVIWAVENGIASGKSSTAFKPKENVTRQELAGFLYKYAALFGYDVSAQADLSIFPDADNASSWARKALSWAVAEKLLSGVSVGGVSYLRPKDSTTRAQVASVIMAFLKSHTPQPHGEINCAIGYSITGDLGNSWWGLSTEDKIIQDLIDDYNVITSDQHGRQVVNQSVVKSISSVMNGDGSKTYTVEIREGLRYNNGDPITAADFVAFALVGCSPAALAAGAHMDSGIIEGAAAYQNGEASCISGLRLLDDYRYALTIPADYVPYYYDLSYASLRPISLKLYSEDALNVQDDGEGVYVAGGSLSSDFIEASRWIYNRRISAGPYTLETLDSENGTAVLQANPYYAGNFEGRKPMIQTLRLLTGITDVGAVANGELDYMGRISDVERIASAKEQAQAGALRANSYACNGYGKIAFQCDFGPLQFVSVRRAVAYLTDRELLNTLYLAGTGSTVNGPYCQDSWLYRQSEAELEARLNPYDFSIDSAVAELEADGWVLRSDGQPYDGSGLRYKKVSAAEAESCPDALTLADGQILMPLRIEWAATEDSEISNALEEILIQNGRASSVGMEIQRTNLSFWDMICYLYRDSGAGEQYREKRFGMYNFTTRYSNYYDFSYMYCLPGTPEWDSGYNSNFIANPKLDDLSMRMVYETEAGDEEGYRQLWVEFIDEWNDCLPDFPIYVNVYYSLTSSRLHGLTCNSFWDFQDAVLYATVN